ncbi:phage baseplate assembly protein [Novosphingobium clariflavum]|uniref:Phage baseplate assembly protein n=1 Tax=Novosphingobium clariflavum TaxID=2029884 RepID=A0ABV6S1J3_9SPHN|nr:hypothetical protein [Novosphingobium clariflavum]
MSDTEIIISGRDKNELRLQVAGLLFEGWEQVEVTLRAEGFPNSFDIRASIPPNQKNPCSAGDECVVLMGADTVISGYVDRVINAGDSDSHTISIVGRGRTQDLVDCGAEWPSHQQIGGNALTIASKLAEPYGIKVAMGEDASPGADVPQWVLNYGESPAEIIQRVARNAGLLAYENYEGKVLLSSVGDTEASSGIEFGTNVESWSVERSMDQRYSHYVCCSASMDAMMELGGSDFFHTETDPNVPRHRLTYLIVENVATDPQAFTIQRAKWEAQRRAGRSFVLRATIDSWRDSEGTLWTPNTLVPVNLPGTTGGIQMVLSEVTYRRDEERGTTAELLCMPKEAFTPEPITLVPVNLADVDTGASQ